MDTALEVRLAVLEEKVDRLLLSMQELDGMFMRGK